MRIILTILLITAGLWAEQVRPAPPSPGEAAVYQARIVPALFQRVECNLPGSWDI